MKLIHRSRNQHELGMIVRKLLNIRNKKPNYSADAVEDEFITECNTEEYSKWPRESRYKDNKDEDVIIDPTPKEVLPKSRRRNSDTFRQQYITAKEIRVRAGTWNVGGELPPDDLDIEEWLDINEPADIYVIGFQEIIPLNAGNVFGTEDSRPVLKWENIIRETLNKIQPVKTKCKCYSDPPTPARIIPSNDFPHIEDEVLLESDTEEEGEEEEKIDDELDFGDEHSDGSNTRQNVFPDVAASSFPNSGANSIMTLRQQLDRPFSFSEKFDRIKFEENAEASVPVLGKRFKKTLSRTEMVGLSWAEPPLDLLALCNPDRPDSLISSKSFKASKSFKSNMNNDTRVQPEAEVELELFVKRKRRSHYVRIVSKQMVGLFLTIWVRRSLRRHIQNVYVSTVGVGVMGYIGNKGSISVSMSIYQTLFCFLCSHLSAGEKETDAIKRNADVYAIHRRTHFNSFASITLPKSIHDHERIIWLGDVNYRINLPYEETQQLISKRDWSELVEYDQLVGEFRKGRAFAGWSEGILNFPPTYKYELNSNRYYGEDPKIGRRTPAWCDRIMSFGKGMKLISYRSNELKISDHRPVGASYMVEIEVFCPKRLRKALTYTDAEIAHEQVVVNMGLLDSEMSKSLGQVSTSLLFW